jgi:signal transduction histidine kinase
LYLATRTTPALTIRDNGPGISARTVAVSSSTGFTARMIRAALPPYQAFGIGFVYRKKLADLLGIHLSVSSREGEGTAFVLGFS